MLKILKSMFLIMIGGTLYCTIELLFRCRTHWTMFLLGGICMLFFAEQQKAVDWKDPFWVQVIRCTIFVTGFEFITGIIVNKWLHWNVWDYSNQPFHLFGQICFYYSLLFAGLSSLGILFSGYLMYWIFGEKKPNFRWF